MDVLNKIPVREQEPKERAHNFEEVCLGYNEEEAKCEASRCINCKNAQCIKGCPVAIDIPGFIAQVKEYKKIGTADVTSAVELSSAQKTQVKEKLLATTRYVEFEMNYNVDPSLIGGMIIRIGDRVVDSSIKTQLYELKKELLNVQLA